MPYLLLQTILYNFFLLHGTSTIMWNQCFVLNSGWFCVAAFNVWMTLWRYALVYFRDPSFKIEPLVLEDLNNLTSVQEITGHLTIQESPKELKNLSFFKNLKVIGGRNNAVLFKYVCMYECKDKCMCVYLETNSYILWYLLKYLSKYKNPNIHCPTPKCSVTSLFSIVPLSTSPASPFSLAFYLIHSSSHISLSYILT